MNECFFQASWILLLVYLAWALLPHWLLHHLRLTEVLPSKYWAVVIPLLLPLAIVVFVVLNCAHNLIRFSGVLDKEERLENDFTD